MKQFIIVVIVATIIACMPVAQLTQRICMPNKFTVTGLDTKTHKKLYMTVDYESQLVYIKYKPYTFIFNKSAMKSNMFENDTSCYWNTYYSTFFTEQCIPDSATELANPNEFDRMGVRTWSYKLDGGKTEIQMTLDENNHPLKAREIHWIVPEVPDALDITLSNLKIGSIDESVFDRDTSNCKKWT